MLACYMYVLSGLDFSGIWAYKVRLLPKVSMVLKALHTHTFGLLVFSLYAIGWVLWFEIVNDLDIGLVSGPVHLY